MRSQRGFQAPCLHPATPVRLRPLGAWQRTDHQLSSPLARVGHGRATVKLDKDFPVRSHGAGKHRGHIGTLGSMAPIWYGELLETPRMTPRDSHGVSPCY